MSEKQQGLSVVQQVQNAVTERGIPAPTWATMTDVLYPGASPSSVMLVWDYCTARNLDPLKKPVHIVPMRVKVGDDWKWRDTVLPGIYEYRITAHRTGEYLGHDKPVYGPEDQFFGVKAPASCEYTVHRWNQKAGMKVSFTVTVLFAEVCGTKNKSKDDHTQIANGRWERAPVQMMTKCAEAAALREAFPEEIGGVPTVEEIEDHMPDVIDVTAESVRIPTVWDKVSEGLRDNLEKAFATLKLTGAQRLAKVNEFIPNDSKDADGAAERLLEWCKDEFAQRQGRTRKADSNKKEAAKPAVETSSPAVPVPSEKAPSAPNGEESERRSAGTETPSQGSGPEAPASAAPAVDEVFKAQPPKEEWF